MFNKLFISTKEPTFLLFLYEDLSCLIKLTNNDLFFTLVNVFFNVYFICILPGGPNKNL
jgi:hypothetical protein